MKSILIIGMGKFGHHLCRNLVELDNDEIMIVDQSEEVMEDMIPYVTNARIGDCTKEEVLKSLGVQNFDVCFVCIGAHFQSNLEITSLLKDLGAKYVVSKTNRDVHAKFLLRNGADEIIYPDKDIAEKAAIKFSDNHIYDYIDMSDDCAIYEIPVLPEWHGKTIIEADIRAKYNINILGIKKDGVSDFTPSPGHVLSKEEHLIVLAEKKYLPKLLKRI